MTISRKPRSETQIENPMAQVFEDVDNEDKPLVKEADRVADLEAQLAELREQREQDRQDALLQVSGPSFQSQVTDTFTPVDVNSVPLPDPALDPDGFSNAATRRAEIAIENKQRKADFDRKRSDDIDTKVETLWANFAEDFPDHALNQKRTEYAAQEVIKRAVAKGIDAQRYMFVTQKRFLKDVAKEYNEIFGEPEIDEDDYEDNTSSRSRTSRAAPPRNTRRRNRSEDDDVARTTGIFGGNDGGRQSSKRGPAEDEPGDMIDDIHKMQKTSGFF